MSNWSQPCCERDWIRQNAQWDGDELISIRFPYRLTDPEIERCAWCGEPTIGGIYVRADPDSVPYPREDEES